MKRCKFVVRYTRTGAEGPGSDEAARFSDYFAALAFARTHGQSSEMADATGLLAQFSGGKLTPEFAHVDRPNYAVVTPGGSVECPHCHWGIAPTHIDQHIREKHS